MKVRVGLGAEAGLGPASNRPFGGAVRGWYPWEPCISLPLVTFWRPDVELDHSVSIQ